MSKSTSQPQPGQNPGKPGQNPPTNQKSSRKLPDSQKTEPQNMPKSIFDMSVTPKQDPSQLHSTGSITGSVSETMTSGSKTVNSLYNQSQATGPILSSGKSEESNFKTSSNQSQAPVPVQNPVPDSKISEPKDQHAETQPKNGLKNGPKNDQSNRNQEAEISEKKSGSVLEPTELKSSFDKPNDKLEKMVTTVTFFVFFESRLVVRPIKANGTLTTL